MDCKELNKLLGYIEENIRVTEQTSIEYIDPRGHIERLCLKQNQIVYGRRGSGKSLLLKSLGGKNGNYICLKTNLEDYKDISFPDSIIQVLKALTKQLKKKIENNYKFYELHKLLGARRLKRKCDDLIKDLEYNLSHPDQYDESIKSKKGKKKGGSAEIKKGVFKGSGSAEYTEENEVSKSIRIDKMDVLKNQIPDLKEIFQDIIKFTGDSPYFIIMDDFYFIRKKDQPYFIDFFHRLTKDTNAFLKVATIKHRSSLYVQGEETYIGMEIRHDAQSLDLDFNLENFEALKKFMKDLLNHIKTQSKSDIDVENLLTENAFKQLCLASGGVPRDFLSLFITLGTSLTSGKSTISKPDVNEAAIENAPNKVESFKKDSAEEKEILEHYLDYIKEFLLTKKRTNTFLVPNSDVVKFSQINQALKELVDLRLLHIVNSNTSSAPSDGKRYSAYMIDIGLYPNAKPRDFRQIEPGEKDEAGREDKIRSAPKLNLTDFKEEINSLNLEKKLTVTEY